MGKHSLYLLVLFSAAVLLVDARAPFKRSEDDKAPLLGERGNTDGYIIVLNSDATDADLDSVVNLCGCSGSQEFRRLDVIRKGFTASGLSEATLSVLRSSPLVEYVEHDQIAQLSGQQSRAPNGDLDKIDQRAPDSCNAYPVGTGSGVRGDYFSGFFVYPPVGSRVDRNIDLVWGTTNPAGVGNLGVDNFSIRWTGKLQPRFSGRWTIGAEADDGMALWIDNNMLWYDMGRDGFKQYSAQIDLVAGIIYDFIVIFSESVNFATARVYWSHACQPQEMIPTTQLYPAPICPNTFYSPFLFSVLPQDASFRSDLSSSYITPFIWSRNCQYQLHMQPDGNLCIYGQSVQSPRWCTMSISGGGPFRLTMQSDGNLVIYTANNVPIWWSGTNSGPGPFYLSLTDDGNLVIYGANGIRWSV